MGPKGVGSCGCLAAFLPNPAYFKDARPSGPLATFDAAHTWVDHPYRDGVALLGDTATSSDPSWGQGLSLTLRDARVLRDHLPVAHLQPVVR